MANNTTITGENWYEFTAFNSQSHYGFGTQAEAHKYCDLINRNREVNVYHARLMSVDETQALDSGDDTDGFSLDLAIDTEQDCSV